MYRISISLALVVSISLILTACSSPLTPEGAETSRLLKVRLEDFPGPQGITGFDEIVGKGKELKFEIGAAPFDPPGDPVDSFERKPIVTATAPDGTVVEARVARGKLDDGIVPPDGFDPEKRVARQFYDLHHGYEYWPEHVFVGSLRGGKFYSKLIFPDIGSHSTAPHYVTVDSAGRVHLMVADVNISAGNAMDLYWAVGDLETGKWLSATLVDQRGFTSYSHPWCATTGETVHLIWSWVHADENGAKGDSGIYYVNRSSDGTFGRKQKIISGDIIDMKPVVDPSSGRIVIAFTRGDTNGVYLISRSPSGEWSFPALLDARLYKKSAFMFQAAGNNVFVLKIGRWTVLGITIPE